VKALLAMGIVALVVVLASAITGFLLRRQAILEEFQALTRSIASTGAIGISGDDLALIRTNEDVEEPEFLLIKKRLEDIRDANELKNKEIYILRPVDRAAFTTEFVVMPDEVPFVGNVYTIRPENRAVFEWVIKEGKAQSTGIYNDEHGTWISAYAPIFDKERKVVALLEVDSEIGRFLRRAEQEALTEVAVGAGVFVLALLPGIYLVNRFTSGLRVLKEALVQFEKNQRDEVKVDIRSRDEVEDLGRSFNEMSAQLRVSTENLLATNARLETTNTALAQRTEELDRSLVLTNTIMATVQEGLCLIDGDGKIEPSYSAALETIFQRKNLGRLRFLDLIRDRVTGKTIELTERFMKVLFNPAKTNHLIPKLNPLKEVEISVQQPDGQIEVKYLSFSFDRVWQDQAIKQALVTIVDITPRIALTRELKESAARMERQAQLLFGVIHVDPALLKDFIEGARAELEGISEGLRESIEESLDAGERQQRYRERVHRIMRGVHRVKGEASVLKIAYYENAAHELEDKLVKLRGKPLIDGKDFIPVVLELSQMIQSLDDIKEVMAKVSSMYGAMGRPSDAGDADVLVKSIAPFVGDLAAKYGKRAVFLAEHFSPAVPPSIRRLLRDVLVQFVRNSMTHGIETPEERTAAGKNETARIELASAANESMLRVVYRDDGRGLDYDHIVRKAQELDSTTTPGLLASLIDPERQEWLIDRLNSVIFHPGFSTAAQGSVDAGRGVGLDLVLERVQSVGGSIAVHSEPGLYCEFVIDIPLGSTPANGHS
jgi:signal transduction histidine kinase/methyl-accepting chemotaxis protein